jgi:hypothetical protein
LARKFLYAIVILLLLVIAGALALRYFGPQLTRWAMIPSASFEGAAAPAPNAYADAKMWLARPDIKNNPATWTPPGYGVPPSAPAAVFFIHPTSYLNRAHWNAPLDNEEANARDVAAAFDEFLKEIGPDRPIILAGHSQGGAHVLRLLRERVAGKPLARRIVAAYAIGWPISKTADLPALGLPECARPDQAGCVLSWQSYAEPSDTSMLLDYVDSTSGLTGAARRGTAFVCTNPLTGTPNGDASAKANIGTLVPSSDMKSGMMVVGVVPAKCVGRGFLSIGAPVDMGPYVLPGNSYHVFDYALFWANVRADAVRRVKAFSAPAMAKP